MTSRPLHRPGDPTPRATWPPPSTDEIDPEPDAESLPSVISFALFTLALVVGLLLGLTWGASVVIDAVTG